MANSKLFKVLALINFLVMLTGFLLYRGGWLGEVAGSFGNAGLTSPNGGTPVKTANDSGPRQSGWTV
jgi:hypothetical protein